MFKKFRTLALAALIPAAMQCSAAETYTITLVDGGTHIVGASTFDLNAVVNFGSQPAAGLDLRVDALMTMDSGMEHTTPVESITDNGDGTYTVDLYYLMPSSGGSWEIQVYVADSLAATFPVTVTGSMMDKVTLNGVNDKFSQMEMATNRPYFIFLKSYDATGGNLSVFVATRNALKSHPALYTGQSLTDESSVDWSVEGVSLNVYDSSGQWHAMHSHGNGTFSISGVSLSMKAHFRLKVNKGGTLEHKTTDGLDYDLNTDPTATDGNGDWVSNGYGHLMVQ